MEVPNAATEKEMKENVVDIEKEYGVSQYGRSTIEALLIIPLPVKESDHDLLISYVNQSLMKTSDDMKELDGFCFGIKAPEGLQPKRFEFVLHPIPGLMGCSILYHKDLDCFDEGHWLTDEIFNFYDFSCLLFPQTKVYAMFIYSSFEI